MKSSTAGTLVFILFFSLVPSSGSYADEILNTKDDAEDLDELILGSEDILHQASSKRDELQAGLIAGRFDFVLDKIEKEHKKEPLSTKVLPIKIAALIGKGDFESAKREMSYFDEKGGVPEEAALLIGAMYFKAGRLPDSLSVYQRGLATNARSPKLLQVMGSAYNAIGKPNIALLYLEKAAETNQAQQSIQTSVLRESIANSYMKLNKLAKAKDVFAGEENTRSDSIVREIAYAKYHASRGEFDKALNLLDVVAIRSSAYAPAILKAQVLNLAGEPGMAIEHLVKLKRTNPATYPVVGVELTEALSHLLAGSPEESLAAIKRIEFSDSRPPNIELVLATINLSLGDTQAATQSLRRAAAPFPEIAGINSLQTHLKSRSLGPIVGLAYFCLDQGYYQQAIDTAEGGLEAHPDNIFLHFILAETYRQTGRYEMALSEFKELSTIMPESFSFRFLTAKSYEEAGMTQQALTAYAALAKERPDFLMAQLAYGKLLEQSGEWEKAREAYEWSLNFKPDSVPLLMALGWNLTHVEDAEALVPVLQTLKANKRVNPAAVLHLEGWAAHQQGDRIKAVELLNQALANAPGDPELYYHLGMAYRAAGDKQKANNLLEQASLFSGQSEKYRM